MILVTLPSMAFGQPKTTGEEIYLQQCASCHGKAGEGTPKKYPHPLIGNRSLENLTRYIDKSMPEDDPEKCTGEEAKKVAAYIYDAFYSKMAQVRNKPARIELSRLTVSQYNHTISDLISSFRGPLRWDDQRGLRGEYFKSRRFRGKATLEQRDLKVDFRFGKESPKPGVIDAKEFSMRWQGSILAPETGDFEFIVRTDNGARLWVNDSNRPLIDAWVKSGSQTEYRGNVRLLGGRVYPLRLEYFKSDKEKVASIALAWKRPQMVDEVIPGQFLSPHPNPETLVINTPFPPDDRSTGFERGTSVSEGWVRAVTEGALEVTSYVANHLNSLAGFQPNDNNRKSRLNGFCQLFAERAFRRPLTSAEKQIYVDRPFTNAKDPENGVKRVVLLVLSSPRFLYREITGPEDSFSVAARLSYELWDSPPDQKLWQVAAAGQLTKPHQIRAQAERMLLDPRCKAKVRDFFFQWLKLDHVGDLAKDRKGFPGFDGRTVADLRTSLELFLEEEVWGPNADFRNLLQADYVFLNGRLSKFYGGGLPEKAPFQKVRLQPGQRAGVLSHPYVMANLAYTTTSSPIHRGVFLARSVMGLPLRPPPAAFAPLSPDLHPNLTTRERIVLQTKPESCSTCHAVINPLGFTLEHYDAVGRYRSEEKGKPIDASGSYETPTGEIKKFEGIRSLAAYLASSEDTHKAFAEQLFHHLVNQPIQAYGKNELEDLRRSFVRHQYNLKELILEIATKAAMAGRSSQQKSSSK